MQSDATVGWGEDCEALLKRCQAASEDERYVQAREAFDLLQRIDLGEDIVFFADEGSGWRVASLAATAGAEEYVPGSGPCCADMRRAGTAAASRP